MEYMDDDTNSTTSSVDVFDEFDEEEYDRIENIFIRDGLRQMPSSTSWTYESFSQRGAEYSGSLKSSIISEDQFHLEYNYIDNILHDKMKVELERTMSMVNQHLHDVSADSHVTSYDAFATVCPEDFFIEFHKWLSCGNATVDFSLPELVDFWRCELIMMSFELSSISLKHKVSQNEYTVYELIVKNGMFRADKPPSTRSTTYGVAKLPPFSFDPIIDDLVSNINKVWVKLFFCSWCYLTRS